MTPSTHLLADPLAFAAVNGVYDLDGAIHHQELGACSNIASSRYRGHYVAFSRTGGDSWVKFNDLDVTPTTTAEALGAEVYVLSYTLRS